MLGKIDIDRMGDLVSVLGAPRFGSLYFELFSDLLAIDQCTVFAFKGAAPPNSLVLEVRSADMRNLAHILVDEYVAGAFEHDPNVKRDLQADSPTVYSLRAADLENSAYRSRFYERPHLAHELVILGRTADTVYYSSFYRRDRHADFQSADLDMIHSVARFAMKVLHRHVELLGNAHSGETLLLSSVDTALGGDKRRRILLHLRDVLLAEPYTLSPREAEVCAGIVLGYTTLGISLNLGISVNTVATHRKHAYSKLGICSQNELFSRYFELVNSYQTHELSA